MYEEDTGTLDAPSGPTLGQDARWNHVGQRVYDPGRDDELETAIVFAIANVVGVAPSELTPPLHDVIDPEGIEQAFFGFGRDGRPRDAMGSVEFRYGQYLVHVGSDGQIHVYEPIES